MRFTEDIVTGMGGDPVLSRSCAVELVREWERHENFFLYDDTLPALAELRRHGLRIGLVSNGQRDLDEFARHHALDVDVCVGSLRHGHVKPHRSIFEAALAALDADPADAAMPETATPTTSRVPGRSGCARFSSTARGSTPTSRTGSTRCWRFRPLWASALPRCRTSSSAASEVPGGSHGARPTARRHSSVCAPSGTSEGLGPRAEVGACFLERRDRADADLLAVEQRKPLLELPRGDHRGELGPQRLLALCVLWAASSGRPRSSHSREKNTGSSAPTVSRRPSAVGYTA